MVNRTLIGLLITAIGVALAVISGLANQLDIGRRGFGWKQTLGIVVGVGLALTGAAIVARRSRGSAGS